MSETEFIRPETAAQTSYRHVFLYAKGWYQTTDNPWKDLAHVVGEYSGVGAKYISRDAIITIVQRAVEEVLKKDNSRNLINSLKDIFHSEQIAKFSNNYKPLSFEDGLLHTYLSFLVMVNTRNNQNKIIFDFGKPDPKILPLSEGAIANDGK